MSGTTGRSALEPFPQQVRPQQVALLGGQFAVVGFLQMRRLGDDNQLIDQRLRGASEQLQPSCRSSESRFIVSLEEMLCALARMPYARPMWL